MSGLALDPAVGLALRAVLAVVFAAAAVHKLRDVGAFHAALVGYDLVPSVWVVPLGAGVIAAEIGIAVALWLPPVAAGGALGGAVLLTLYAAAMGVNLARGRHDIDCGCAGPAGAQPISRALAGRNLVLAAAAAAAALPISARPLHWIDIATIVAATAALLALYAAVDGLLANAAALRRMEDATAADHSWGAPAGGGA